MNELLRNELEELKKFFIEEKHYWADGLFQVLFLLEDVKVGVDLQGRKERRRLKHLKNMLYWFNLYVSVRHGGYATKNEKLYKEWNKFFGFKKDAEKFLGYPSCCVQAYNLGFGNPMTSAVSLYSLIKDIKSGRKSSLHQFLVNSRFLHHSPCKNDCMESTNLARKYDSVIKKYHWLVADLLPEFDEKRIKIWIQSLELLPTHLSRHILENLELLSQYGLNPNDVKEILENGRAFRENLEFGITIFQSL